MIIAGDHSAHDDRRDQYRTPGSKPEMTCTNCGSSPLAMRYTLRFSPAGRSAKEIQLYLCDECLSGLCSEPDIELVVEPSYARLDD